MSSSAPSKRQYTTHTMPAGKGVADWFWPLANSTVGGKILIALTGLALTGYVIAHFIGNLKLFGGQESINGYAKFLKDLGPLLWVGRIATLLFFLLHIFLAIKLKNRSRLARPIGYAYSNTIQASIASRTMLTTGLLILAFVLFHLAHYTFGYITTTHAVQLGSGNQIEANYLSLVDAQGRHDVYSMVVAGFRQPVIAVLYILAQLALFVHLSHGVSSTLQTLGLNTARFQPTIKAIGYFVAALVAFGNIAIVVAVWANWVPAVQVYAR